MRIDTAFEIEIFTFGELTRDPDGRPISAAQRLSDVLEWARLAHQTGLDEFGVGEHHRDDFAIILYTAVARSPERSRQVAQVRRDRIRLHRREFTV